MKRRLLSLTGAALGVALTVSGAAAQPMSFEVYALIERTTTTTTNILGLPVVTVTETERPWAATLGPYAGSTDEHGSAHGECERYRGFYEERGFLTLGCRE